MPGSASSLDVGSLTINAKCPRLCVVDARAASSVAGYTETHHDVVVGDRIELVHMGEDPDPIPPGSKGTVVHINDIPGMCQIGVEWDPEVGRSLAICPESDEFKIIETEHSRRMVPELTAIRDELKG